MYDVFISYSRKDYFDEAAKCVIPGNVVSKIMKLFDENEITYWFDKECIYSGDKFPEVITKSIRESTIFLFVSTTNSNASDWTAMEISTANFLKKKIIPFRVDVSCYADSVLLFMSRLDFIAYYENKNDALKALLESIKKYLRELDEKKIAEAKNLQKQERINNLNNEIGRLKNQQDAQMTAIKKNLASIMVDKETYNELMKKIEAVEDELYLLQHGSNREHKPLVLYLDDEDKLKERIKELENQINTLNEEKQNLLLKIELLERNEVEYREKNEEISEKLSGCEKEIARLEGEFSRINEEKADLEKEKQTLESKLKNFEISQAQDKLQLDKCKKENDELLKKIAALEVAKDLNIINGHEYVDLGLPSGTLWATCNVGASSPEDYGYYFALGETTTKSIYSWSTYKWCRDSYDSQTKYNTRSDYGTVDNRKVLELSDDAAHVNWGGSWRMPTYDELEELKEKCNWQWTSQGGKNGYRVTGPNGKSIFLPAAGYYLESSLNDAGIYGYYRSSSFNTGSPDYAYNLYFNSSDVSMVNYNRYYGRSVRPVCPPQN